MTLDIVTYLCNIRDMNIKEQIKAEHEKIKNLSDEVINTNLEHLRSDHIKINFCSDSPEAYTFLNKMEDVFMDKEDLEYYNFLLGRKAISWSLAVISTI